MTGTRIEGHCNNPRCNYAGQVPADGLCPSCGGPMTVYNPGPPSERSQLMLSCKECKATISESVKFCTECGSENLVPLRGAMFESESSNYVTCGLCGLNYSQSGRCPRCYTSINESYGSGGEEAQGSAPMSFSPGGPAPYLDHPLNCVICGGVNFYPTPGTEGEQVTQPGAGRSVTTEWTCENCGNHQPIGEITWSRYVTPGLYKEAVEWVSFATMTDEEGTKALANAIVWEEDGARPLDSELIAQNPPIWLGDESARKWENLVRKYGCTTYNEALKAFTSTSS